VISPSRDLYLTTYNRQTSLPPAGFESAIPAVKQTQAYALDGPATGIDNVLITVYKFLEFCFVSKYPSGIEGVVLYSSACGVFSFLLVYHAYVTESRREVRQSLKGREGMLLKTNSRTLFFKLIIGE